MACKRWRVAAARQLQLRHELQGAGQVDGLRVHAALGMEAPPRLALGQGAEVLLQLPLLHNRRWGIGSLMGGLISARQRVQEQCWQWQRRRRGGDLAAAPHTSRERGAVFNLRFSSSGFCKARCNVLVGGAMSVPAALATLTATGNRALEQIRNRRGQGAKNCEWRNAK